MAMTSTRELIGINVNYYTEEETELFAVYQYTFDDPDDEQLPVISTKDFKFTASVQPENHDQRVHELYNAVFPA
jgi:hypothetical protein